MMVHVYNLTGVREYKIGYTRLPFDLCPTVQNHVTIDTCHDVRNGFYTCQSSTRVLVYQICCTCHILTFGIRYNFHFSSVIGWDVPFSTNLLPCVYFDMCHTVKIWFFTFHNVIHVILYKIVWALGLVWHASNCNNSRLIFWQVT